MNDAPPIYCRLPAILALSFLGFCVGTHAQTTAITIQAGQAGTSISPHLIGIFLEDLNYAADACGTTTGPP